MVQEQFIRTAFLLGEESIDRLEKARVAVFGIGGVGGYVVEALARSGVGELDLIDNDVVCLSNINRQIIATHKTLGAYKVDAAKERVLDINPYAKVNVYKTFYLPETAGEFDFKKYDYIVDAIDTVTGKLQLAEEAFRCKVPLISSMGAGNKLNAAAFEVADISQTSVCPLAKVMRRELRKRGIEHLKVVYSKEVPIVPFHFSREERADAEELVSREERADAEELVSREERAGTQETVSREERVDAEETVSSEKGAGDEAAIRPSVSKRQIPGSNAFVPSAAGLIIAGEVVKDLTINLG